MDALSGFGFSGFRSFYGDVQTLYPLTRVNLIAGQNNSGKSNVLRVVRQMSDLSNQGPMGLDVPRVPEASKFQIVVRLGDHDTVHGQFCATHELKNSIVVEAAREILRDPGFDISGDGSVWLRFSFFSTSEDGQQMSYQQSTELDGSSSQIINFLQARNSQYSDNKRLNASEFLRLLRSVLVLPTVQFVDASRRVDDVVDDTTLVERLAKLQNPDFDHFEDKERFAAINRFLQSVTDDPTARLEIPYPPQQINVWRGSLVLPLASLGTGIAQVVMLAASATLEQDTVVCIEEPEVHLHPLLQRKLIRYLLEETANQYLIATHSAHMLDSAVASVFHATSTGSGTKITLSGTPSELREIGRDLGYRPSDLLQTNCAIWVEGPSDRIYLVRWLYLVKPELLEGIDYSIMFYGGSLLSHLSTEDPGGEVDFISLRRLNRHLAVVIDSDRSQAGQPINATKRRIKREVTDGANPGHVWITQGRFIESYIPPDELGSVLKALYPNKQFVPNIDSWADALRPADGSTGRANKVAVAREVVRRWQSGLDYLDLRKQVTTLARLIEDANGHVPTLARNVTKAAPVFDGSNQP